MVLTFGKIQIELGVIPSVIVERFDPRILSAVLLNRNAHEDPDVGAKINLQRKVLEKYARTGGNQGRHATQYHRSRWGKAKRGRRFAAGARSLQSFARPIRHTIAAALYFDADMENCHPILLAWFCAQHKMECPWLNKYNLDRSSMFASLITAVSGTEQPIDRTGCKELVLKIINGGRTHKQSLEVWGTSSPDWVSGLSNEMASVRASMKILLPSEFKLVEKERTDKGKPWNFEGALINRLMNVLEDNALQYMFKFFLSKGMAPGVLCFDGLMVPKTCTDEAFDLLCAECTTFVQKESGYPVRILRKKMNEGFLEELRAGQMTKRGRHD
jgi:hypothetical protein